ncbi:FxsB family cyclophane-forming radical SAM/SPASM peptide maturase [Streptomyces sp. NPDC102467]|uniref:FxsB family cyclophane-forming radical SAM/SPASM peptide maturase n=1 Tax=Streptomyces sp. NPDC102467 TaxID=3366179 RepID=UPI003802E319
MGNAARGARTRHHRLFRTAARARRAAFSPPHGHDAGPPPTRLPPADGPPDEGFLGGPDLDDVLEHRHPAVIEAAGELARRMQGSPAPIAAYNSYAGRSDTLPAPRSRPSPRAEQPLAFQEFVVKLNSRCNLACRYCYVYESGDEDWRRQPVRMSDAAVRLMAKRVGEHVRRHRPATVRIVFHGGEPLLSGVDLVTGATRALRKEVPADTFLQASVQTNGVLLDRPVLEELLRHRVSVGVSLDGPPEIHDRLRRDRHGRGTHARVAAALRLLASPRYRPLWDGVLTVVDPTSDPAAVYRHLSASGTPVIGLNLPLANWDTPPPAHAAGGATPYGDWLATVFDLWLADGPAHGHGRPDIPLFSSLLALLDHEPTSTESLGAGPSKLAVVETDGSLRLSDHLKFSFEGADRTGLHLTRDSFDDLLAHPGVRARQTGIRGLCSQCRSCPLVEVCGGGHFSHRYRRTNGYANPSVYCHDLARLIQHAAARLQPLAPPAMEATP